MVGLVEAPSGSRAGRDGERTSRVAGTTYLHLVSAVDAGTGRVQISNNRGRVNGWTSRDKVYGICTAVEGVARPHLAGKIRES